MARKIEQAKPALTWPGFEDPAGEESKLQNAEHSMFPHMPAHRVSMGSMFTSVDR